MNSYPLIRTKLTNEHIMAALFVVLMLYMLPNWYMAPSGVLVFLLVTAVALILDAAANFVRYKRPTCAVSAAVTAGIMQVLTLSVPLWGQVLGVLAALVLGKHIWGGTGKNPLNPAVMGLILIYLIFPESFHVFQVSALLIPALILSLPFALVRPFVAAGYAAGTLMALGINGHLNIQGVIGTGIIFWSCLVITDPTTSTNHPFLGVVSGIAAGFLPFFLFKSVFSVALGIIIFNAVSFIFESTARVSPGKNKLSNRIKRAASYDGENTSFIDLTGDEGPLEEKDLIISTGEALSRIRQYEVFGFGGAGFPVIDKITAVGQSKAEKKYFIINAAECDPGLIHDKWLTDMRLEDILSGIRLISGLLNFESITLASKNSIGHGTTHGITFKVLPDLYPAGAEKILIRQVLGIELAPEDIPAKEGILVLNVQTVLSVYEAVYLGKKADTRYLTVLNLKDKSAAVARVRLGANIRETAGKVFPVNSDIFSGGGIMQSRLTLEADIIDKKVNFIGIGEMPRYKESPLCSGCGLCSSNCPQGLKVNKIVQLVDEGRLKETMDYRPERCISCGSCSYVCLAGRNLALRTGKAKAFINNSK